MLEYKIYSDITHLQLQLVLGYFCSSSGQKLFKLSLQVDRGCNVDFSLGSLTGLMKL